MEESEMWTDSDVTGVGVLFAVVGAVIIGALMSGPKKETETVETEVTAEETITEETTEAEDSSEKVETLREWRERKDKEDWEALKYFWRGPPPEEVAAAEKEVCERAGLVTPVWRSAGRHSMEFFCADDSGVLTPVVAPRFPREYPREMPPEYPGGDR